MTDTEMTLKAIDYISKLFRADSGGHDADHSIRVYHNAMRLADTEPACDRQVVALASLLHDADDYKLFQTQSNANTRLFLHSINLAENSINRICEAINSVSFSSNGDRRPSSLEGKIVQDADRLDAIGAIGIARTFAYGGKHGRSMSDSVRHFYDKLLLLKDRMNTPEARRLAERRHAWLESFLQEWYEETENDSDNLR